MDALALGLGIGAAAGISPGPLLFLMISAALRSGPRTGVLVALAPLLSDLLVVTVVLLTLGRIPSAALDWLGVVGGLFVIWLGIGSLRDARREDLTAASEHAAAGRTALRRGVLVNLVSPHPWVAWATALGPYAITAWRDSRPSAVAFVAGFYLALVGAKVVLALLIGRGRRHLGDRGYRIALSLASALLICVGVALAVEFGVRAVR